MRLKRECVIVKNGKQCQGLHYGRGLCYRHYHVTRYHVKMGHTSWAAETLNGRAKARCCDSVTGAA